MFYRLYTLIMKELQSLLQEPQTRAILILPVIFQMILFPLAATLEVTNTTIAIFDQDSGEHSIELTQRLAKASAFSQVLLLKNEHEIRETLDNRKALLVVRFGQNFSADIASHHNANMLLLLDGRNSNSAQIAANYVAQIVTQYQHRLTQSQTLPNNSELIVRNWYNPNLDYKWFIVPSLVAL
ncbi:membrane protein, partial [Providencia rettgeri]